MAFLLKRWIVSVRWASGAVTSETVIASTRGKAMVDAWRCDAFCGSTFGEFLRFSSCRRDHLSPARWGDPITVQGKPAHFLYSDRQYVHFVYADEDRTLCAHPFDVLPVEYRPDTYRRLGDDVREELAA